MSNLLKTLAIVVVFTTLTAAQTKSPGAGPIIVLETVKETSRLPIPERVK